MEIGSPDPGALPVMGVSAPRRGEFRVSLRVPEDFDLGTAGVLSADLALPNGSHLAAESELVIDERLGAGGETDTVLAPA